MGNLDIIADKNFVEGGSFEPLPAGVYEAMITSAETKETKTGGMMVKATFTILDPEYQGRLVFQNFNIVNASAKAQQIGLGQLSSCCRALGFSALPSDTADLCNIPLKIKIAIKPAQGEYPAGNEIKEYLSAATGKAVAKAAPVAATATTDADIFG